MPSTTTDDRVIRACLVGIHVALEIRLRGLGRVSVGEQERTHGGRACGRNGNACHAGFYPAAKPLTARREARRFPPDRCGKLFGARPANVAGAYR